MFYTNDELNTFGFKSIGDNVLISKKSSIYNPKNISIGDNVRIDDFCVISAGVGGINIGNNVHIAVYCSLIGNGNIQLSYFSGLSSKISIYSSTDDYSGDYLTNPTVDSKFTNVISGDVFLGKHVIVGSGSVILPNVTIGDCSAVASLSLVSKNVGKNEIVGGIPAKKIKNRGDNLKKLECEYLKTLL
jgi:galactoside O-acetyltransferase